MVADRLRLIYLPGLGGHPELSPALAVLDCDVVVPQIPGLVSGEAGFVAPPDHLGWLTAVWDALDDTGALPCPVVGASVGGMLAADLAIFRPEAVTRLALLAPLGICDPMNPGQDPFALPPPADQAALFHHDPPPAFSRLFPDRDEVERQVGSYLVKVAAASLIWPIGDRGLGRRVQRIRQPSLLMWGEEDRIAPVTLAERWPLDDTVIVPDAGHLLEWDAPDRVAGALRAFLQG